jgi:hypothetical protein
LGTSRWTGHVKIGADWIVEIPKNYGAGEYDIMIGLWDPAASRRYVLEGDDDGSLRYRLGKLVAQGKAENVTNIRLIAHKPKPRPPSRWNAMGIPIDFGHIVTEGALRCEAKKDRLVVTALPDVGGFTVAMLIDRLKMTAAEDVKSVIAVDSDGKKTRSVSFETKGNVLSFDTREDEFAYQVLFKDRSP